MTATIGLEPSPAEAAVRRLTVGEMQAALAAARAKFCDATAHGTSLRSEHNRAVTQPASDADSGWLPDHDGAVTLTSASPPRRTSSKSQSGIPLAPAPLLTRSNARRQSPRRTSAAVAQARAELAAAPPRRLAVIPACGGSGATTLASLLAAVLAPVVDILLVAGEDQGALAERCGSDGGDMVALAAWAAAKPAGQLSMWTPGLGVADFGDAPVLVAAPPRCIDETPTESADAVLAAAAAAQGSVVIDTPGLSHEFTRQAIKHATGLVVTAPRTAPGLLAVEFCVASLRRQVPDVPVSVTAADVFARTPSRGVRAALARLSVLRVPAVRMPFDRTLAVGGAMSWHALRPRTQTAACDVLMQLTDGKDSAS